jgi:hypothetical protein
MALTRNFRQIPRGSLLRQNAGWRDRRQHIIDNPTVVDVFGGLRAWFYLRRPLLNKKQ